MTATGQPSPFTDLGFDPAYRPTFEDKLFVEGPQAARRLLNFFALLLLATVIATYGILSSSSPTIIGAMVVAPLMGPIMATTAAVIMGSAIRALRALTLAVVGTVSVVVFSYLLSWVVPDVTISFASNPEISSRIQPGLYALLTALGSGAVGAFILSRAEVADALSGVAIAISLVPPLCVVGISLQHGQIEAARGALLLFLTNAVAILFAGGLTFFAVGLGRSVADRDTRRIRRRGFIAILVGLLLVLVPLTWAAAEQISRAEINSRATATTLAWLAGSSYRVDTVTVGGGTATVSIEGSGTLPPPQQLANELSAALGQPITLTLRAIPAQTLRSTTAP
jgi:uncharacterized hydrophobic protein (TIGR00271 family)